MGPTVIYAKLNPFLGSLILLRNGSILGTNTWISVPEVEKGVEHGSIAPRRKLTGPFLAEGFGPRLPHLSRFL